MFARLKPSKTEPADIKVVSRFGKQKSVQIEGSISGKSLEFTLDWIFKTDETQETIFEISGTDRVAAVLGGYNATLLCYGQTGAGKTHTMFGPDEVVTDFDSCDPKDWGLVPRATEQIFGGLAAGPADSTYEVRCSYLEVYNDALNCLLGEKRGMVMREGKGGVVVDGLAYMSVTSSKECMAQLNAGNAKRIVAAMAMNPRSSRGHGIFTIYIKEANASGERNGKLNLVDLAGMESSKKSYPVEGASNNPMRREEAKNINVSLYALGGVIEGLSKGAKGGAHIPWRNSKLTRVLQDGLGGNAKTSIIVALRSEAVNVEETIQTLRFAQRAKAIKVQVASAAITQTPKQMLERIAQLTEELETSQLLVRQLQTEIERRDAEEAAGVHHKKKAAGIATADDAPPPPVKVEIPPLSVEVKVEADNALAAVSRKLEVSLGRQPSDLEIEEARKTALSTATAATTAKLEAALGRRPTEAEVATDQKVLADKVIARKVALEKFLGRAPTSDELAAKQLEDLEAELGRAPSQDDIIMEDMAAVALVMGYQAATAKAEAEFAASTAAYSSFTCDADSEWEGDGVNPAIVEALNAEITLLKKKNRLLVGRSILARIVKGQTVKAIEDLKAREEDMVIRANDAELLLKTRDREIRDLQKKLVKLAEHITEHSLHPHGRSFAKTDEVDGTVELQLSTIKSADADLKAAIKAKDPERIKKCIVVASDAVARARAKAKHMEKGAIKLQGSGTGLEAPTANDVSDEEKKYLEFHEWATARKLNLASRGYEVMNVFVDDLYDEAVRDVPYCDWHEFIRMQLPSPRKGGELEGPQSSEGWRAEKREALKQKAAEFAPAKPPIEVAEHFDDITINNKPDTLSIQTIEVDPIDVHMDVMGASDAPIHYVK